MPVVHLTQNLRRFFPALGEEQVGAGTVRDVVAELDGRYPGLGGYLVEDDGSLRKHVNIFVDGELIRDRTALGDPVGPNGEVHVIQALSGG